MSVDPDRLDTALRRNGEAVAKMLVGEIAEHSMPLPAALLVLGRSSWLLGLDLGLRIGAMDRIGAEEIVAAIDQHLANGDAGFTQSGRELAVSFIGEVSS